MNCVASCFFRSNLDHDFITENWPIALPSDVVQSSYGAVSDAKSPEPVGIKLDVTGFADQRFLHGDRKVCLAGTGITYDWNSL